MHPITSSQQPAPDRKRRRVPIACDPCRARKSRCDGAQPSCSACYDFDEQDTCVYQEAKGRGRELDRRSSSRASMNQRLKFLEQALLRTSENQVRGRINTITEDRPRPRDQPMPSSLPPTARETSIRDGFNGPMTEKHSMLNDLDSEYQSAIGGMAAIVTNETSPAVNHGYFGPTSNLTLIDQIAHALSHSKGYSPVSYETPSIRQSSERQDRRIPTPSSKSADMPVVTAPYDMFALPPEGHANDMLREYFSTTNLFVPCLQEEDFMKTYEQGRQLGSRNFPRTWLATLNLVFAITTTGSSRGIAPSQEQARVAEVYYQRAIALCMPSLLKGTSCEIVQLLVLAETFLQGSQRSVQTWTFHGLTVDAAFQAGLHSTQTLEGLSLEKQELRKRTWYCCVMNDCTFSVVFGRPPLISERYVKMDLPADIPGNRLHAVNIPSLVSLSISSFNAEMSALCAVTSQVVERLFDQNFSTKQTLPESDIFTYRTQYSWQLAKWRDQLPKGLTLVTQHEVNDSQYVESKAERFRIYLTLRYLHLKILLHRPVLEIFIVHKRDTAVDIGEAHMMREQGTAALLSCLDCCYELIGIVGFVVKASQKNITICNAWWLTSYYAFNASLVIFGILLASENSPCFSLPSTEVPRKSIETGLDILRVMDKGNKTIWSCRAHLERLLQYLDLRVSTRIESVDDSLPAATDGISFSEDPHDGDSHQYWDFASSGFDTWSADQMDDVLKGTMSGMDFAIDHGDKASARDTIAFPATGGLNVNINGTSW